MTIEEYDFELPEELIAQEPLADRKASRMLAVDCAAGTFADDGFSSLPSYLREGDVLVVNNTRVFPARLLGRSETGARVEIFLVRRLGDGSVWETLARPARRLREGKRIIFGDKLSASVVDKSPDGKLIVEFSADGDFDSVLDELGRTPLPPYIKRDGTGFDTDRERYQTVYARTRGSIAAPTAGLHFTDAVLDEVRSRGVTVAEVTLHVGYGTFEPVRAHDLADHKVSPEAFEIGAESAEILNAAKRDSRRIVAVGTTTTRTLESALQQSGEFSAGQGEAGLTITPGYRFRAIDGLLTNFHLPMSSLLVLTSTFGGRELIMRAYAHAVAARYRFYSYGDCMLIL
jgi:S-adenosylmethionine:tRNA ribosyltransferase-isomerase